jgi:hypothetical protein
MVIAHKSPAPPATDKRLLPEELTQESCPPAADLVEQARQRLAAELEEWPPVDSPLLWAELRSRPSPPLSPGARIHYIRVARTQGRHRLARDLFVGLLEEIETSCAAWARRCVGRTVVIPGNERERLREELRQELALRLWDEVGLGKKLGWELFFPRALTFAEQHVASSLMQQRGYWPTNNKAQPQCSANRLLIHLQLEERADRQASPMNLFSSADLCDLRELVRRLPVRPRTAIVLRYWQDATEGEIAQALGGVTTRTVRNYLRQGHALLRGWYAECEARRI